MTEFKLDINTEEISDLISVVEWRKSIDWPRVEYFLTYNNTVEYFYSRGEAEVRQAELLFKDEIKTVPVILPAF